MAVKARAIRKAEVDARKAAEQAEQERSEAEGTVRQKYVTIVRAFLALAEETLKLMPQESRQAVLSKLTVEDRQILKAALEKLL